VVPAGRLRLVSDSSWGGGGLGLVRGAFGSGNAAAEMGFGGGGRLYVWREVWESLGIGLVNVLEDPRPRP
jgi:hypothetical protein